MIRINPFPEKENLSDDRVYKILKAICQARNDERIKELIKLSKALERER